MRIFALFFEIDSLAYCIDTSLVEGVLPNLSLNNKPSCLPPYLSEFAEGILTYKNYSVPVIDCSQLIAKKKAKHEISTRIALIRTNDILKKQNIYYLGLRAEKMLACQELISSEKNSFSIKEINLEYTFVLFSNKELRLLNITKWMDTLGKDSITV